jgi:hypothetical protein
MFSMLQASPDVESRGKHFTRFTREAQRFSKRL